MSKDEMMKVIRLRLAPARISRITFESDEEFGEEIAKVHVTEHQLDAALAGNGLKPRSAAMDSGISVEVVLEEPTAQTEALDKIQFNLGVPRSGDAGQSFRSRVIRRAPRSRHRGVYSRTVR